MVPIRIPISGAADRRLDRFGYGDVLRTPARARRRALARAVAALGAVRVMRRLNAIWIVNRGRPALAAAFLADRDWVGRRYLGWTRGAR